MKNKDSAIILIIFLVIVTAGILANEGYLPHQIIEERNKVSAELEKLKESAVVFTPTELKSNIKTGEHSSVSGYFTLPTKFEDKITYLKGKVTYAKELGENYVSITFVSDTPFGESNYNALMKLTSYNHYWKSGDTFEGYVKFLPYSEYYNTYPDNIPAKFSEMGPAKWGNDYGPVSGKNALLPHFEEVKMIYINSKNVVSDMR